MNYVLLVVGGKEYKLKATTAAVQAAEARIGKSLLAALETIDQAACFAAVLWAGLQKFHHGFTMERVYGLIDDMLDNGCEFGGEAYPDGGMEMRVKLAMEVLKVSGFFTREQRETMDAAMPPKESSDNTIT